MEKLKSYPTRLARFRASTAMLATKVTNVIHLGQGRSVILQLGKDSMVRPAVRTKHLWLTFTSDSDGEKSRRALDGLRFTLVKIWSSGSIEHLRTQPSTISESSVDISCLKPGDEAVVEQGGNDSGGFRILYKEEVLILRLQNTSPLTKKPM